MAQHTKRFYRRSRFWRKLGIILGVLLVVYLLVGFFLVPWILHGQLEKRISDRTGREVTIEDVAFNPFLLAATIEGFRLHGPAAPTDADPEQNSLPEDLLSFRSLRVDLSSASIWHLAPVLDEVRWEAPEVRVAREADGSLSFDDVVARVREQMEEQPEAPEDEGLPGFRIERFDLVDGAVHVRDAAVSPVFTYEALPINFSLVDFGTLSEDGSSASLQAEGAEGARFAWDGDVLLEPFRSEGEFRLERFSVGSFQTYMERFYAVEVASSEVNLRVPYAFNAEPDGGELLAIRDAELQLRTLSARKPADEEPFFAIERIDVSGMEFFFTAQEAAVEQIAFSDGHLLVERQADGQLGFLEPLATGSGGEAAGASGTSSEDAETPASSGGEEAANAFAYRLGGIQGSNFSVRYVDRSFEQPLEYPFMMTELSVGEVTDALDQPVPVALQGHFDGAGLLQVEARITPQPLAGEADVELAGLPLAPLSAVAATLTRISSLEGTAGTRGTLVLSPGSEGGAPAISYTGEAGMEGLLVAEIVEGDPLFQLSRLDLAGMTATTEPIGLTAETLSVEAPQASLKRLEDGSINVLQLVSQPGEGEDAQEDQGDGESEAEGDAAPPFQVEIAAIQVSGGDVTWEDRSVDPVVRQRLHDLQVTIEDFALSGARPVRMRLQAQIEDGAQLETNASWLAGQYEEDTDLGVILRQYGIPQLSPYAAEFIGYRLQQGELVLDLTYDVSGAQLDGSQQITINDFELGEQLEGEDAPSLPIGLAVSLLKDRNGNISLNVPISGDLGSPEFSFASVIQDAIGNVISRAATAPFRLIGSVFGGGGDEDDDEAAPGAGDPDQDLSFVAFEPGAAELDSTAQRKLDTLARALYERPQLTLEYYATLDREADREALARQKLSDQLRQFQEQAASAETSGVPAEGELDDPQVYEQVLAAAYRARQGGAEGTSEPATGGGDTASVEPATTASAQVSDDADGERAAGADLPSVSADAGPGGRSIASAGSRGFGPWGKRTGRGGGRGEESRESSTEPETQTAVASAPPEEPGGDPEEAAPPPSREEMESSLLADIEVTEEDFAQLRSAREQAVRQAVMQAQSIEDERFRAADAPDDADPDEDRPDAAVVFAVG